MRSPLATLLVVALALAASGCGEAESPPPPPPSAAQPAPAPTPSARSGAEEDCERAEAPAPQEDGDLEAPKDPLEADSTYEATVTTNCGEFTFELDQKAAPKAAASFVALAEDDFFNDTVFHRIAPGFVIQGGDPKGDGTGGPGYKTKDRPPADARYTKGVVAMAKGPDEDPGTAGSQFFVVTGDDVGLPAEYAVLGKVTDGQDVVERIGKLGDPAEQPTETVVIESISIDEQ